MGFHHQGEKHEEAAGLPPSSTLLHGHHASGPTPSVGQPEGFTSKSDVYLNENVPFILCIFLCHLHSSITGFLDITRAVFIHFILTCFIFSSSSEFS